MFSLGGKLYSGGFRRGELITIAASSSALDWPLQSTPYPTNIKPQDKDDFIEMHRICYNLHRRARLLLGPKHAKTRRKSPTRQTRKRLRRKHYK